MAAMSKGVYVPADPQFPRHFHGIGIRIEDEVVVGAEHPVVLSANAPKEVCPSRAHYFLFTIFSFDAPSPLPISSLADCRVVLTDRGCRGRVPGSIGLWAILKRESLLATTYL